MVKSNLSVIDRFCETVRTFFEGVTTTCGDVVNTQQRSLDVFCIDICPDTGAISFLSPGTMFSKYCSIFTSYFEQIGFGSAILGMIFAALLPIVTVLTISGFTVVFVPVTGGLILMAPFTLGISLGALVGFLVLFFSCAFLAFVCLACLWLGLICAAFGIGFVYEDTDACGCDETTEEDHCEPTTTPDPCGEPTTTPDPCDEHVETTAPATTEHCP